MIIHNQVSENVIGIGTIIIGVNIIVSMNNIANVNHHKTKLMKNNQTAFGSSCFIVYEFNDFNRKADDLSLSHYNTCLSTHMIKRIKKFSSPKMRNREFVFTPKIEYKLVAESAERADKLREANQNSLTFPIWCCNHTLCSNLFRTTNGLIARPACVVTLNLIVRSDSVLTLTIPPTPRRASAFRPHPIASHAFLFGAGFLLN